MAIDLDETGAAAPEKKEAAPAQPFEAQKTATTVKKASTEAGVISYKALDGSEIKLSLELAQNLVEGGGQLTKDEFILFAAKCKARSLNPFTKECYPIKFAGANAKVAIIENWSNFVRVADSHPQYDGLEDGLVVENEKGELIDVEGQIIPKGCKLIGAWAKVYRKDRRFPFVSRIDFNEFSKGQSSWKTMPAYMISKCAKSIAYRLAFPDQLAGSYIAEEMQPRVIEDAEATPII